VNVSQCIQVKTKYFAQEYPLRFFCFFKSVFSLDGLVKEPPKIMTGPTCSDFIEDTMFLNAISMQQKQPDAFEQISGFT